MVESYPNAPVVLVAIEAKLTEDDSGWEDILQRPALRNMLAEHCPIFRPVEQITHTIAAGAGPAGVLMPHQEVTTRKFPRFTNRSNTLAIGFPSDAVVVQTTNHSHYADLRRVFAVALETRNTAGPVDGVTRLGLRYIDEIRVPNGPTVIDWAQWVDDSLIGPGAHASALGLTRSDWQGLTRFDAGDARQLVLRYGARTGYAVNPDGDLRRLTPAPGPFFLLDIDSFWEPSEVPEFAIDQLLACLDDLHRPVRELFETLIKNRLREEVLSHAE